MKLRAAISLITVMLLVFGRLEARTLQVVEYGAQSDHHGQVLNDKLDPRNTPSTLAVTADGAIWFRENFAWHPRIARFAADGTFKEFDDPYAGKAQYSCNACLAFGYAEGFTPLVADGNDVLVGPMQSSRNVLALSADGTVTPRNASGCLAAGPNIACFRKSKTDITFRDVYAAFNSSSEESVTPNSAVLGPDSNTWFTDSENSQLGRIRPDGSYMTFTSGLSRWDSGPQFIAVGPDGNLWFTEKRDRIGRITLDGQITEFSNGIPKLASLGGIVAGPDGALWFTLFHGMVLGRMTLQGRVTIFHDLVYPSDGHDYDPVGMIVRDKSGRLYFNEGQAGRIARLTISPQSVDLPRYLVLSRPPLHHDCWSIPIVAL